MKYISKILMIQIILLCVLFLSCQDRWDDYYNSTSSQASMSLYNLMQGESDISIFTNMVAIAGYDSVLNSTKTYTVWAPVNDALSDINLSNIDTVKQIVKNHISRFSKSSATSTDDGIRMIDNKIYYFSDNNNVFSFGGKTLVSYDEVAKNGLLHKISDKIPYTDNLYEYVRSNASVSKIANFLSGYDEEKFDSENSIEVNIDDEGRPVYDTVTIKYNRILEDASYGLGAIGSEDSIYTMLVPNNDAWNSAYQRISPYFKIYNASSFYADSVQNVQTSLAIINDLIFRTKVTDPNNCDSLVTTSGSVIHDVAGLFSGAIKINASNGLIYKVSDLNYNNTETWNKPIAVEGEDQEGRTYNNSLVSIYTRSVTSSNKMEGISNQYIEVVPNSTTTNPVVTFKIPNVLSGSYNIYAVLVPASIDGEDYASDSTRIGFTLSYLSGNGQTLVKNNKASTLVTSGTKIVKMLAYEKFAFPISNYYDNLWEMDEDNTNTQKAVTTTLSIMTNVSNSDFTSGKFSRSFRLDRIILEPIRN